jgi:hypothetical protein
MSSSLDGLPVLKRAVGTVVKQLSSSGSQRRLTRERVPGRDGESPTMWSTRIESDEVMLDW